VTGMGSLNEAAAVLPPSNKPLLLPAPPLAGPPLAALARVADTHSENEPIAPTPAPVLVAEAVAADVTESAMDVALFSHDFAEVDATVPAPAPLVSPPSDTAPASDTTPPSGGSRWAGRLALGLMLLLGAWAWASDPRPTVQSVMSRLAKARGSPAAAQGLTSPMPRSRGGRLRNEVASGSSIASSGAYGSEQLYRISTTADKLVMTPMRRSRRHAQSSAASSPAGTPSEAGTAK